MQALGDLLHAGADAMCLQLACQAHLNLSVAAQRTRYNQTSALTP